MTARKSEIKGVSELLLQDYETPEEAAKTIINWLDEDRGKRVTYVGLMVFGGGGSRFSVGVGPYPGRKSAVNAVQQHPASGDATGLWVVPLTSPEGVQQMVKDLDTYQKPA